jgi:hypothetical protein
MVRRISFQRAGVARLKSSIKAAPSHGRGLRPGQGPGDISKHWRRGLQPKSAIASIAIYDISPKVILLMVAGEDAVVE